MARGRVPGKSKAAEEATEEASKVSNAPPSKKTKPNDEEAGPSVGKQLVKITIEHCNS